MAYKKNHKKLEKAIVKLQQIKQQQITQNENNNGNSIKPGI